MSEQSVAQLAAWHVQELERVKLALIMAESERDKWKSIALDARSLLRDVHPWEVWRQSRDVQLKLSGMAMMGSEPPHAALDGIYRRIEQETNA